MEGKEEGKEGREEITFYVSRFTFYALRKMKGVLVMSVAMPSLRRFSRAEYVKMAEGGIFAPGEHTELIEGEIFEMSPQKSSHATTVMIVADALRSVFTRGYVVRTQVPLDLNEISEPEPDVIIVSGTQRDYKDAHPTTALLVVEVSDTTLAYDRNYKASLYAKAGIADYWIVNLMQRRLEVYRAPKPIADMLFGYGYGQIMYYMEGDEVTPLAAPQSKIAVTELLP